MSTNTAQITRPAEGDETASVTECSVPSFREDPPEQTHIPHISRPISGELFIGVFWHSEKPYDLGLNVRDLCWKGLHELSVLEDGVSFQWV